MIALRNQSIRSSIRTVTLLAALISLLLTMLTPFVGTAHGAHDDPYDASNGSLDDATFAMIPDDCGGNSDSVASGGTKLDTIHLDDPAVLTDSSATPKDNLCDFWVDSTIDAHGDVWLYAAFTREASSGTAHVALELLDSAADCDATDYANCNPWEDRTDGTRIIGFTWQGNDGLIDPTLWDWTGSGFSAGQPLGTAFTGSTGLDGLFGEIAVNLTQAGILANVNDTTAPCDLIAAIIPLTLPGFSLGSQPKDVVLGTVDPIQTCGSLKIVKSVDGGDDFGQTFVGVATSTSTPLETEALGHGDSDTFDDLKAQSFTITEKIGTTELGIGDSAGAWTLRNIDCGDGSATDPDDEVTIVAGQTATCTLYNTPDLPDLTLLKKVINDDGGEATYDDFTPTVSPAVTIAFQDVDAASPTSTPVDPDTYTLGEVDPGPEYDLTSIVCDDAANTQDSTDPTTVQVTLALGDDVTCTFTNDDVPGQIIVEKTIIDPDGLYPNVTQDDFAPTIATTEVPWDTAQDVDAGTYAIDEVDNDDDADDDDAYLADGKFVKSISCDDTDGGSSATVGIGELVTCEVTNTAVGAGLVLVKDVDNEWGGTLDAEDFVLEVDGDEVAEDQTLVTFPAGTYEISEVQQPGYEFDGLVCLESGENAHTATPVQGKSETFSVTVAAGESVVCTFNNSDRPGELTVVKDVINDDGGTATDDDFSSDVDFTAFTDGEVASGNEPASSPDWEDTQTVPQGDYTIGESTIEDGYALTGVACYDASDIDETWAPEDGATPIATHATAAEVAIAYDEHVVCIVTNDDQPSQLTLVKDVVNDDGGVAVESDFDPTLDYDGADEGYETPAEPTWTSYDVPAGTFTIGEEAFDGYDMTGISCTRGEETEPFASTEEGDTTLDVDVMLDDDVTCTVVNDDQPATLILDKDVVNDDGGTADKSDFTPTVDYEGLEDAEPATNSEVPSEPTWNDTENPEYTVPAGDYTIGELIAAGYLQVGVSCDVDGETVDGAETASFTLGNGETADCVVTNDDIAPGLTVVKQVINDDGGTLDATDFPLQVTDGEGTTTIVETDVERFVDAGTYTIDEVQQAGYALTDLSCVRLGGEEEVAIGELGEDGESIVVALGLDETVICTVVNDDIAPTVVLRKTVVNDDGGTLTQEDFPVTFDGDEATWDETITTMAGDHVAAEETQPGYLAGDWGGDCAADGSLTTEIGETYECTITNDDVPAGLTVVKQVVNDDGGSADASDFPLTVTPEGGDTVTVTTGVETLVGAGTYTVSEEQQPGYALTGIACDNGVATTEGSIEVTVGLDEAVICTLTNDDLPIGIQVVKVPDVEEITFVPGGADEIVTYTYTVTNTGETTLTDLSLFDDVLGEIELPVDELVPDQIVFATAEHVVTEADAEAGEIVNVAVVEGTSPDGRTTDDDDDAEVLVDEIEVLPNVVEKPAPAPVLPATGFETLQWALWAALVAAMGALFLLSTGEVDDRRRRRA